MLSLISSSYQKATLVQVLALQGSTVEISKTTTTTIAQHHRNPPLRLHPHPNMNLSTFRPVFRPFSLSSKLPSKAIRPQQCLAQRSILQQTTSSPFSSTSRLQKRKKGGAGHDPRITTIRYHLSHPLTPRPLHFSRTRSLRHWTIHRAWLLFLRKRRAAEALELERQYASMRAACEHLRLLDDHGNRVEEHEAGGQGPDPSRLGKRGREVGRLYRSAMLKRGVWGSVPVEYAKVQTDFPAREGWNHAWTRV